MFEAIADRIAKLSPVPGTMSTVPGRVLSIDADMLCYVAGGFQDISFHNAKESLEYHIRRLKGYVGASKVILHITPHGSDKGERGLVAIRKPYQGNRKDKVTPENVTLLKEHITAGKTPYNVVARMTTEADDTMAEATELYHDHWIATKDKDLRSVYGGHVHWDTGNLAYVPTGSYEIHAHWDSDLYYGDKFFWFQMLAGDPVDNIPNLRRGFGKVRADKTLTGTKCSEEALEIVAALYKDEFGEGYGLYLMEAAALLYMRRKHHLGWAEGPEWVLDKALNINNALFWELNEGLNELAAIVVEKEHNENELRERTNQAEAEGTTSVA